MAVRMKYVYAAIAGLCTAVACGDAWALPAVMAAFASLDHIIYSDGRP
jgi:hypothetical protein